MENGTQVGLLRLLPITELKVVQGTEDSAAALGVLIAEVRLVAVLKIPFI